MKKTVLIFGISSFVGSNLAQALKDEYRIIGTYFKTPVEIPGITSFPCDVLKKEYVANLIGLVKPDVTIYAIGLSSLSECKMNPKTADALNSAGAVNVCTASERNSSKFIYISSSYVLGGEDQLYKEGDTPFPNTVYGNSLSSTEFWIQRSCLNYLILRCSPLYGRGYGPKHPNWFEVVQAALAQNRPLIADDSVITGFLDVAILGKVLKSFLSSNVTNRLFQISSRDSLTRYEFAKLIAKTFKKDENLIQRTTIPFPNENSTKMGSKNSAGLYCFRMDTYNVEDFLGASMPTIADSLQITFKRLSGLNLAG
ncbi:MAG: sugar nucleotide-binding protein [Bdellovibrionales bacterium]|nr:sugar nucleotide-binding protein [Bdellovibrionales bacterium]